MFLTLRRILLHLSDLLEIMFLGLSEKFCELEHFEHCGVHVSMAALPFNSWIHGAQLSLVGTFPSSAGSAEEGSGWKIRASCICFFPACCLYVGLHCALVLSIARVESCVHMAEQCHFCLVINRLIQLLEQFLILFWVEVILSSRQACATTTGSRTSLKVWSIWILSKATFLPQDFVWPGRDPESVLWQYRPGHRHWACRGWAHWGLLQSSHRSQNGEIGNCWSWRMDKDPAFPFSGGHAVSVFHGGWVLVTRAPSGSLTWVEFQSCQDTELVFQAFL